jgi:hypothetical protein
MIRKIQIATILLVAGLAIAACSQGGGSLPDISANSQSASTGGHVAPASSVAPSLRPSATIDSGCVTGGCDDSCTLVASRTLHPETECDDIGQGGGGRWQWRRWWKRSSHRRPGLGPCSHNKRGRDKCFGVFSGLLGIDAHYNHRWRRGPRSGRKPWQRWDKVPSWNRTGSRWIAVCSRRSCCSGDAYAWPALHAG